VVIAVDTNGLEEVAEGFPPEGDEVCMIESMD